MNREAAKRQHELEVFFNFLNRADLSIDPSSVRNGDPHFNEPDILCTQFDGEAVGFELSRLTDRDLARMVNRPIDGEYARLCGHSLTSLREKLGKSYSASKVDLLLYPENIGTPDSTLIPQVKIYCRQRHSYNKIWFMSKKSLEVLYARS